MFPWKSNEIPSLIEAGANFRKKKKGKTRFFPLPCDSTLLINRILLRTRFRHVWTPTLLIKVDTLQLCASVLYMQIRPVQELYRARSLY